MDFDTPEDWAEPLRIALDRMREVGWVERYTLEGLLPVEVMWTDKGESGLALLRHLSRELRLTEGKGVAATACWLAEQFGPDIGQGPRG